MLANAIVNTGVFAGQERITVKKKVQTRQLDLSSLFEEYGRDPITQNHMVHEDLAAKSSRRKMK